MYKTYYSRKMFALLNDHPRIYIMKQRDACANFTPEVANSRLFMKQKHI